MAFESADCKTAAVKLAIVAGAVLVFAVASGCGGTAQQRSENSSQRYRPAGLGTQPLRRLAMVTRPLCTSRPLRPTATQSYAAVVRWSAVVRKHPVERAPVLRRYPHIYANRFPTVFAVLDARLRNCKPVWLRVELPSKPNGSTGWVLASQTKVYPVSSRIVVDLSSRRARLYRWGTLALDAPVAVGKRSTPTPVGSFYVDQRFLLDSPNGPFGVAALGISAHSDVLQDWVDGGPIALHGTNDPGSIGRAVSHGCVRLRNADVRRLLKFAPAGTPVLIRR
jgi:L,D-transpeptidase catalytic domain